MNIKEIEAFAERFYPSKKIVLTPFAYNTTFLALAQNATQTAQIVIAANADFIALGMRERAQIGAAQTVNNMTAPFCRVLITDNGSNEQFTNQAVDLVNYCASGVEDRSFPYPRIIQGRSSLTVTLTNYAPTAETYTSVDLMLYGFLVRAYGN